MIEEQLHPQASVCSTERCGQITERSTPNCSIYLATSPSNSLLLSCRNPRFSKTAMDKAKARRYILTGAIALITATGAYTGAVLKTETEKNEVGEKIRHETPAEKIQRLEGYRAGLVRRKTELELKIAGLEEKQSHRTE
ncbi:hypothetical protein L211DRAFT_699525 [Terfezia boudieri ATCC MYA-4762]|uniref:Uncharacterized protein n=1 Tax=Terfezia boudieri ATCC MYA-4762 TaxID=1051890 RepID=A0A3N4LTE2_9PEZI|nr:hypothetical protein L211DRAFT_699525 [Terfezia boudieri ATCC MYA-4762]